MKDLANKVAVVTGAASGIGRGLAVQLDKLGVRLALTDINAQGLEETANMLQGQVFSQVVDVADKDAMYAFADAVMAHFQQVDIVINNAGVAVSQTVENITYDDFEWLMGINFWGVVYGTKAFLPHLKQQSESAVVNISSVFGLIGVPTQSSYNAAKFAVRGFTESLRHEMDMTRTGVTAISVHPGGIRTNIVNNARFYEDLDGSTDYERVKRDFQKMARTSPDEAALTIIKGIRNKNPRVLIGADAQILDKLQRLLPVSYYQQIKKMLQMLRK